MSLLNGTPGAQSRTASMMTHHVQQMNSEGMPPLMNDPEGQDDSHQKTVTEQEIPQPGQRRRISFTGDPKFLSSSFSLDVLAAHTRMPNLLSATGQHCGYGGQVRGSMVNIVGTPVHHEQRMHDRREKDQIVQYEPTHRWWEPPAGAWIFRLNREILLLLALWNTMVALLARYTKLCGEPTSGNLSPWPMADDSFCDEDWLMSDDAVYNTLGVGMFLLLTFRAHDGYDRFWEGRSALGRIRECCRDLTRQICFHVHVADSSPGSLDAIERRRAVGFVGAFASTLKLHLRKERNAVPELGDILCFQDIINIEKANVMPQLCLDVLSYYLVAQQRAGKLDVVSLSAITQTCIAPLVDKMGTCERIRNTPVPLSYILHLRFILILWLLLYPFHLVAAYGWFAILLATVVDFAVLGIESMACEVENPFGYDKNCIDMDKLCRGIVSDTQEILDRVEHRHAELVFDGKAVRALNHRLFSEAAPQELRALMEMAASRDVYCQQDATISLASVSLHYPAYTEEFAAPTSTEALSVPGGHAT